jgi:hypothetical protein
MLRRMLSFSQMVTAILSSSQVITLLIFRELGYAPMSVKFPPITAPHVLYTVEKKIEIFSNFFSYSCFDILKLFSCKKRFLNSFYDMLWTIFHLFQYCNFTQQIITKELQYSLPVFAHRLDYIYPDSHKLLYCAAAYEIQQKNVLYVIEYLNCLSKHCTRI